MKTYRDRAMKYKRKYMRLKKQLAGQLADQQENPTRVIRPTTVIRPTAVVINKSTGFEKITFTLKKLTEELINIIASTLLETGCCLDDINMIQFDKNKHNTYQQKYLINLKKILGEYFINIHKSTKNITKLDRKEIKKFLTVYLNSITIDNFTEIFNKYLWPICVSFIDEYLIIMDKLIQFEKTEKIPEYKLNPNYKSPTRHTTCIDEQCCDKFLNAGKCFELLGGQRLTRILMLVKEMVKQLEDAKNTMADREKLSTILDDLKPRVERAAVAVKKINTNLGTVEELNKQLRTEKSIWNKLTKPNYGSELIN